MENRDATSNDLEFQKLYNRGMQLAADLKRAECELEKMKAFVYSCNMSIVQQMTGREFEIFLGKLMEHSGSYTNVEVTKASGDCGADILAVDNGKRICFQAKHMEKVGYSAIKEVYAAAAYYQTDLAAVITSGTFTREAREVGTKLGILLLDGTYVSELMERCIALVIEAVRDEEKFVHSLAATYRSAANEL